MYTVRERDKEQRRREVCVRVCDRDRVKWENTVSDVGKGGWEGGFDVQ